jgi:hypothetical protein
VRISHQRENNTSLDITRARETICEKRNERPLERYSIQQRQRKGRGHFYHHPTESGKQTTNETDVRDEDDIEFSFQKRRSKHLLSERERSAVVVVAR